MLTDTVSVEGRLLMLDDVTPHVAVPVQAIRVGEWASGRVGEGAREQGSREVSSFTFHVSRFTQEVVATTLSDEKGKYRFFHLPPGRYQVRCQILGGYVYYRQPTIDNRQSMAGRVEEWKDGRGHSSTLPHFHPSIPQAEIGEEGSILQVEHGKPLTDIDFRFAPFKKGMWKHYTVFEGLVGNHICAIYFDSDEVMWVGTTKGVSRYDGRTFVNFTTQNGLAGREVYAICETPDGDLWCGTNGGVSRLVYPESFDGVYPERSRRTQDKLRRRDGKRFVTFTQEDGLADNCVRTIICAPDGVLWFGTEGGVSRYDGKQFITFTQADGLADNHVHAIHCDPTPPSMGGSGAAFGPPAGGGESVIWFGTAGGLSRYDGKAFVNFTTEDGLAHIGVTAIYRAPDRMLWIGTVGGLSRHDGREFVNLTTQDGLVDNAVRAIHQTPDGALWVGTDMGVSRYDGKTFVNFTHKDGLVNGQVWTIPEKRQYRYRIYELFVV